MVPIMGQVQGGLCSSANSLALRKRRGQKGKGKTEEEEERISDNRAKSFLGVTASSEGKPAKWAEPQLGTRVAPAAALVHAPLTWAF